MAQEVTSQIGLGDVRILGGQELGQVSDEALPQLATGIGILEVLGLIVLAYVGSTDILKQGFYYVHGSGGLAQTRYAEH